MLPIRWDPFRDVGTLPREFDDLLRQVFGSGMSGRDRSINTLTPVVNMFVKDNTYHFQAELPGVAKEDLDISIEENMLVIKGERKDITEKNEDDYLLRVSRYGSFIRKMTLPEGVDTDHVHAACKDGILEITMPIVPKEKSSRKIMVEGETKEKKVH